MTPKKTTLRYLEGARGDDLYRASAAFRGMTLYQMNEQYGESGKTRQQIIDGYEEREREIDAAIEWVKGVQP